MEDLLSRSLMKAEQSEARDTRTIIMEHKWYVKEKTERAETGGVQRELIWIG